jgi:Tol biopolymer transport system component
VIFKRSILVFCVFVVALSLVLAGTAEAAKGGKPSKPPDDPPTPEPPANPEIVLNYDDVSGGGFSIMNADGSNVTPIVFEGYELGAHWGTWSPDGQRLAFKVYTGNDYELWSANLDGTDVTYLANGLMSRPRWSPATDPDSPSYDKIAYCDSWTGDTMLVDADGGDPEVILDANYPSEGEWYLYGAPAWSADGSRLANISLPQNGETLPQIVAVTVGSTEPPEILFEFETGHPYFETLAWARQHNWMAFSAEVGGVQGVYVLDLDGPTLHLAAQDMVDPTWSPDDSKLLVLSAAKVKVGKKIYDNEIYIYEGFSEVDFGSGSLALIRTGHFPEWKRCVTDPDTGICSIPGQ